MADIRDIAKDNIEQLVAPGERFKMMVTGYSIFRSWAMAAMLLCLDA